MRRLLLALAVLAGSGCARNAYLELTITLPANTTGAQRYAVTQVMAGSTDFNIQWGGDNPIAPVLLDPAKPQTQKLSIEGTNDNETSEIRVKVTFCKDPSCLGTNDENAPAAALQIERAFYIGQRTNFTWKIDCIPAGGDVAATTPECVEKNKVPEVVSKCQVGGCRAGTTSNYCAGGKHFCEDE